MGFNTVNKHKIASGFYKISKSLNLKITYFSIRKKWALYNCHKNHSTVDYLKKTGMGEVQLERKLNLRQAKVWQNQIEVFK